MSNKVADYFSHLKLITPLHMDIKPHDEWCAYEPTNNLPDGDNVSPDKHILNIPRQTHLNTHNQKKQHAHWHTHLQGIDWQTETVRRER